MRDLLQPATGQLWEPIAHLWDNTPVEEILKSVVGPDGADGAQLAQLYSIDSKQTIADAVVRMAKKTLNFLVAVDEHKDNEIQGVITERHYVAYGAHTLERKKAGNKNSTNEQIDSIMTPRAEMLHAPKGMSGSKCLKMMVENNVRSVGARRAPSASLAQPHFTECVLSQPTCSCEQAPPAIGLHALTQPPPPCCRPSTTAPLLSRLSPLRACAQLSSACIVLRVDSCP